MSRDRPGRPRDPSRDDAILDAALDVLADGGYAAMTVDAVAARAGAGKATIYRRWDTKDELVIAAVRRLEDTALELDDLPDTGSLRDDLLALFRPAPIEEAERRMRIALGLTSLLMADDELAAAAERALTSPWITAHSLLIERAIARGEVDAEVDVDVISQTASAMAAHRTLVQRRAFDREFLVAIVDSLIVPALDPHRTRRRTTGPHGSP